MVLYKVIDALADTYECGIPEDRTAVSDGKIQRVPHPAFRDGVFYLLLRRAKELVTASVLAVAAQILGFLLFDAAVIRRLPEVDWVSRAGKKWRLLKDNTLLFFSVILDFYIFSASKYAIENCMADRDLAVYGAIFMPTSVINLGGRFCDPALPYEAVPFLGDGPAFPVREADPPAGGYYRGSYGSGLRRRPGFWGSLC